MPSAMVRHFLNKNHAAEDLVLGGVIVLWVRVSRPQAGGP